LFAVAINLTEKKKSEIKFNSEILARQISETYLYNKKIEQIIQTKKTDKQKILIIFCKTIKLELENCTVVKYLTINIKYLFVRDKIYISRSTNNTLRIKTIRFQYKLLNIKYLDRTATLEKIQYYYY